MKSSSYSKAIRCIGSAKLNAETSDRQQAIRAALYFLDAAANHLWTIKAELREENCKLGNHEFADGCCQHCGKSEA